MERQYQFFVASSVGMPVSAARQVLRALRESGLVPGNGIKPTSANIARIVLALSSDTARGAPERVNALRMLPLRTACGLPSTAEAMVARLVDTISSSPVLDEFDIDGGSLHIGPSSIVLDCLSLTGKRAAVRYGDAPADAITTSTSIPISTVRKLAESIRENSK
jgi:hypothetical protein